LVAQGAWQPWPLPVKECSKSTFQNSIQGRELRGLLCPFSQIIAPPETRYDRSNGRNELGELINFWFKTADGVRLAGLGDWRLLPSTFNEVFDGH